MGSNSASLDDKAESDAAAPPESLKHKGFSTLNLIIHNLPRHEFLKGGSKQGKPLIVLNVIHSNVLYSSHTSPSHGSDTLHAGEKGPVSYLTSILCSWIVKLVFLFAYLGSPSLDFIAYFTVFAFRDVQHVGGGLLFWATGQPMQAV